MKAILLAAGFGTRLFPITEKLPKCLISIKGSTMLEFWIKKLQLKDISQIVVNTHHFAAEVENEIGKFQYRNKVEISHEKKLLGTAGTLIANVNLNFNTDVLVIHCDNFSEIDLQDFLRAHRNRHNDCLITMAIFKTNNVQMSGMIKTDVNGVVNEFVEKPLESDLTMANAAVYLFDKSAIAEILECYSKAIDISVDILPNFIGRIQTYSIEGFHMDMGTIENLQYIRNRFEVIN